MSKRTPYTCRQLTSGETDRLKDLLAVFAAAFADDIGNLRALPGDAYLAQLLAKEHIITVVAERAGEVVGGLSAYILDKFERDRREVYIYDLAVAEAHRRQGIAKALIEALRDIAAARNIDSLFVQAHEDDAPAIALYESFGSKTTAHHFDIAVQRAEPTR
jgi:aminoglycoside 3-N-acetyltransferase I